MRAHKGFVVWNVHRLLAVQRMLLALRCLSKGLYVVVSALLVDCENPRVSMHVALSLA